MTQVLSVIFCAIRCTVTEVESGIVKASNKELQVFSIYLYDTNETNSIPEIM
jgi:hypothetical protein